MKCLNSRIEGRSSEVERRRQKQGHVFCTVVVACFLCLLVVCLFVVVVVYC